MDIDLLSKMVRELLLDNDSVALPGLGTFVAEPAPAAFSDKGYTINPPYRKLYFRQNRTRDNLLVQLYAASNEVPEDVAGEIITSFLAEMREVLNKNKVIVFPELGRLRATKENNYFFVSDEEMDIYPDGIGLEPVSLKAHFGASEAELPAMDATAEPADPTEPEPTEPAEPEPAEPTEPAEITDTEVKKSEEKPRKNVWKTVAIVAGIIVGAAVVALLVFIILSHVSPDFIDSLLYTEEELRILNS